jgi:hypothetical protein
MPAGFVVVIQTFGTTDLSAWESHIVDVTGLVGVDIPQDPEPEFVSINENNMAVVTLQENNALVLIDLEVRETEIINYSLINSYVFMLSKSNRVFSF